MLVSNPNLVHYVSQTAANRARVKTSHSDAHVYADESKSDKDVGGTYVIGNDKNAFKLNSHATIYSAYMP